MLIHPFSETNQNPTSNELLESEGLFRLAFSHSGIGMALLSIDGHWLQTNPALHKILGYTESELQETTFQALTHPDDLLSNKDTLNKLMAGEIPSMQIEKRYRHAAGHYIWSRLTTTIARGTDGKALYYVSQIEDITEQKQVREQFAGRTRLNARLIRMQQVFEHSTDGLFFTDVLDDGRFNIVEINPAFTAMSGVTEEYINLPFDERQDPGDGSIKFITSKYREVVATKKTVEYEVTYNNNTTVTRYIPVFDENGQVVHVVGMSTDITNQRKYEEALYEREQEFRTLVENSPDIIIRYNRDLYCVYANPAYLKFAGFSESEALGVALEQKSPLPSNVAQSLKKMLQQVFETGTPGEMDMEWSNTRGEYKCFSLRAVPEFNNEGIVESVISIARDITERKCTEEMLMQREKELRALTENIPDPIFRYNRNYQRIYVNPVVCRILGKSAEELINNTPNDGAIVGTEQSLPMVQTIQDIFSDGKARKLDIVFVDHEGKHNDYNFYLTPEFDSKGHIETVLGIARDITERKIAEKKLSDEHFKLSEAQRLGRIGSWELDLLTDKLEWSDEVYRIFERDSMLFKPTCISFLEIIHPDDRQNVDQSFTMSVQNKTTWDVDYRLLFTDGRIKYISGHSITIYDDKGAPLRSIGTVRDMTLRKEAELELLQAKKNAEESDRLKSAFLATMNHELRTPLNAVMGFSELLKYEPDKAVEYASIIYKSGQNLLEIINDVFKLSMAEHSEITIRTHSFNLGVMFSGSKMVLSEILDCSGKNNRIELVFNPDPTLFTYCLNSDLNKINQVLGNLFKNAVKFTDAGKIELGMRSDKPGWLTFYLSDTGIGIPENKQSIIFDPFRQVDDSNCRIHGGIGIGLAISDKIARVLKGSLSVVSEPCKGSTFYFSIPAELYTPANVVQVKSVTNLQLSGKIIMIAEDDTLNLYILKMLFSNSGAHIIEAANGKEAIEKYSPNIDLVLMDLKMPIIDGFAATRFIKSKSPQMPVIAVTAFAHEADKRLAREAGCSGVVLKPVDRELLFAEIGRNMNKPEALKAVI